MSIEYAPLATEEDSANDYKSIYSYDSVHDFNNDSNYKSVFKYSKKANSQFEVTGKSSNVKRYCEFLVIIASWILFLCTLPWSAFIFVKKLDNYERYVIFRLGHMNSCKGPGFILKLPFIDRAYLVDLRPKAFSVPPQKILTIDGAIVELGADVYYKVKDAVSSVACVKNIQHSVRQLAHTLIHKRLAASENLASSSSAKTNAIAADLKVEMNEMTSQWGIIIDKVEFSTIKVLQEATGNAFNNIEEPMKILSSILCPRDNKSSSGGANGGASGGFNDIINGIVSAATAGSKTTGAVNFATPPVTPSQPKQDVNCNVAAETLIRMVKPLLNTALVQQFSTVYCFKLCSRTSVKNCYYLDLANGSGSVGEGEPSDCDVTLTLQANDLHKLITGDISIFSAYMTGRIEVDGDLTKASQLSELLKMITDQK